MDSSPLLSALVAIVGINTAVFAYAAGSVQTDIKAALSFASLSQVGIIVTEIGMGFRYVALIHILGHACLRTLQFVRAPTLLHDYHTMENAIGGHLPRGTTVWARSAHRVRDWVYRLALERGYLDALLRDYVALPFVRVFHWFDALERQWTDFLAGGRSRESDDHKPHFGTLEDLS
jgi:NAD(P)H-quinone oxidoreductase subunit 5